MEWRWHGAEDGGVLYIVGIGWDRIGSGCQATRTVVQLHEGVCRAGFLAPGHRAVPL